MDNFIVINKDDFNRVGISVQHAAHLIITFERGTEGFEIIKNRYSDKKGEATLLEVTDLLRQAWGERPSIDKQIDQVIGDLKQSQKDYDRLRQEHQELVYKYQQLESELIAASPNSPIKRYRGNPATYQTHIVSDAQKAYIDDELDKLINDKLSGKKIWPQLTDNTS